RWPWDSLPMNDARLAWSRDGRIGWSRALLLERVLDLVPGLLEVALGLVGLAFGLQFLIVGGVPHAFLDLALDFGGLVSGLVLGSHDLHRPSGFPYHFPAGSAQTGSARSFRARARLTPGTGTPSWPRSSWACRRSRTAPGLNASPATGCPRPRSARPGPRPRSGRWW